jgi:hypothetical protein
LGVAALERYLEGGGFAGDALAGGELERGDADDLERELDEAERWLRMSAAHGFWRAEDNLARVCAERGRDAEALEWLTRAAEQRADPEQAFKLGMHHWHGTWSTAADSTTARVWMLQAATMGHPVAQLAMGSLASCEAEAWRWLVCAAGQGYMEAAMLMGHSERWPRGVDEGHVDELRRLAAGADGGISSVELPAGAAELLASFRVVDAGATDWEAVRSLHRELERSGNELPVREPETLIPLVDPRGRSVALLQAVDAYMVAVAAAVRTLEPSSLDAAHVRLLEELARERHESGDAPPQQTK